MAASPQAASGPRPAAGPRPLPAAWAALRTNLPWALVALLPAALTIYLAFNAGGYFAGAPAALAVVLLIVLAARVMLARDPAAGLSRPTLVAAAALALFAVWTLLSGAWSGAHGRALVESDRALLYLAAFLLFSSFGGGAARLRWMIRGVAGGAVVVCSISLMTRALPAVWPIEYESIATRLNYPITYWNTLGLLAAMGLILCFGMTSDERESRVARVVSCAAMPLLASTLLLTLSRGGILVWLIGIVVFAVVGHPRALVSGLLAAGPTTAIAAAYTYNADLLVSADPLSRAARDQGETLAIVISLCMVGAVLVRALLLRADARLRDVHVTPHLRRRLLVAGALLVTAGLAAAAVAVDLPRQYDRFIHSEVGAALSPDPRSHLRDVTSNGRFEQWRVAYTSFEQNPIRGAGAGTYELSWNRERSEPGLVRDGHSLYLEVLGELGLVGLAFIACALLTILVGTALRIRGPNRAMYATIFAACLAWVVAASFDWHWEMPVVTLAFFALAGAALAREIPSGTPVRTPPFWLRGLVAGACCLLVLLVPLRVAVSQDRLKVSLDSFLTGRCGDATATARSSLRAVGSRPQPYEVMALCALIDRKQALAVTRMGDAVRRDPENWRLHYGLARMQAMTGRDPRRAAREALRLNPREPLAIDAVKRFERQQRPAQWRRAAQGMEILLPEI